MLSLPKHLYRSVQRRPRCFDKLSMTAFYNTTYKIGLPLRTALPGCMSARLPSAFSASSNIPWL